MQSTGQPELTPEQMEQIREEIGDEYNLVFLTESEPNYLKSAGLLFVSLALVATLFVLWRISRRHRFW